MTEIWKDIKGYEGLYQVSNHGRIKSIRYKTSKLMVLKTDVHGYVKVGLRKSGKRTWYGVHRLVAVAFLPNPNNFPQVDHIDNCKTNNHVDNLQWLTARENVRKDNSKAVIATDIYGREKRYEAIIDVRKDGMKTSGVTRCIKGLRKTHGGYTWRYAD